MAAADMMAFELASRPAYVGGPATRVEDDRLLAGHACYVADIRLPGMAEMHVVRSPLAHARIEAIVTSDAASQPGVVRVITAKDLVDASPFPDFLTYARPTETFALARERVRYVGAPVAAVVAEDRYLAEDAAELVSIDYDPLPAVASMSAALTDTAPQLFDDWTDNAMVDLPRHDPEVERILEEAPHVVRGRYSIQRHTSMPIETRGCVAEYRDGRLTLWTATQSPHIVRTTLSYVLPVAERDIRVVAPDVGGGFGCKCHVYPEEVLVCWLAMKVARPIRWIEDRSEHMVATNHSREHVIDAVAAVAQDGTIQALRCHIQQDVGSGELFFPGTCPTLVAGAHMTGPYRIDHAEISLSCVVTNKTPAGAFRGFGIPEAVFALERLVEKAAREVGADPLEVRRRMLLRDEDLPHVTPMGGVLDSGSFRAAFERAVEMAGEAEERTRGTTGRDRNRFRIGTGIATYIEGTAPTYFGTTGHWVSQDAARIRVEADGTVVVSVGVTTTGQGVTTMVATLAADALGVPRDAVRVEIGDTDRTPYGLGGWGSRSTVVGGGAILKAATPLRKKILQIASHLLEADVDDLVLADGHVQVRGDTTSHVSLQRIATAATIRTVDLPPGMDPGLEASATYDPPGLEHVPDDGGRMNGAAAWANATHAAVVEVDVELGDVRIVDYIVVHDCGPIINPQIVEGQILGGVVHGIGGALYEHLAYGEDGQPLATSFMDYVIPSATETPPMALDHFESPSPTMPLGVKGVGEGGTIGPPAAIANAVADALREFDIDIVATPITPGMVRQLVRAATPPTTAADESAPSVTVQRVREELRQEQ